MRAVSALTGALAFASCFAIAERAAADAADECIAQSEMGQRLLLGRHFVASRPHLVACGRAACPPAVVHDCVERLQQAEASMATVLPLAKRADGATADGASVLVDEAGPPVPIDGSAIDVDPGPHTFRFIVPGTADVTLRAIVVEGARRQEVIATFPAQTAAPSTSPAPEHASSASRTLAYVLGGTGLAGLAAGALLAGLAAMYQSREVAACSGTLGRCGNVGTASDDYGTAGTLADASTASLVAGAALLGAGAVFWLAAPRSSNSGFVLAPNRAGVSLRADF